MLIKKFFRLYNKDDASGGGGAPDRGDTIPDPEAEALAQAEADAAAAAKIEADLAAAKKTDKTDETADPDSETADPDEDKAKPKKDSRIPLARHEAILKKEREARQTLETQLAQYQRGGEVAELNTAITATENKIIEMDTEYNKLLTDGHLEKAAALMSKIRTAERQMAEAKSDMKIAAAESRATERARYNVALDRVEAAFPILNPDHADFNADTMAEVVELKDAYQLKGLTPTMALQKAVKLLVEPRTTSQEVATTSQPRVDAAAVAAARKTDAVKKTAETVGKQPASLGKVGADSDKLGGGKLDAAAVMKMSQKQFAGLSEETLAQMRGDTV